MSSKHLVRWINREGDSTFPFHGKYLEAMFLNYDILSENQLFRSWIDFIENGFSFLKNLQFSTIVLVRTIGKNIIIILFLCMLQNYHNWYLFIFQKYHNIQYTCMFKTVSHVVLNMCFKINRTKYKINIWKKL